MGMQPAREPSTPPASRVIARMRAVYLEPRPLPPRRKPMPPATDLRVPTADLLARCREGDDRAWNQLVDRYEGLVWSVAVQIGLDRDDASDVFQYVWMELHRSLARIRDAESLPKWLMVATRRQAYKVSARSRRLGLTLEDESAPDLLDPARLPDDRIEEMETRRRLEEALARMKPADAQLLRLLFLDPAQPSYEEISRRTGLAIGSIGPIRARCLKRLRALMEESR